VSLWGSFYALGSRRKTRAFPNVSLRCVHEEDAALVMLRAFDPFSLGGVSAVASLELTCKGTQLWAELAPARSVEFEGAALVLALAQTSGILQTFVGLGRGGSWAM